MAKRRKEKDAEEDVDFNIPKFDEKEFVNKEREKIRATVISFLFGILIAVISFGFWTLLTNSPLQWTLVFLFGLFNGSWIRYLFSRFNIEESVLERKGQFTSYAIYFLTWLFVLIILINPPFYDGESPTIQAVSIPEIQELGGSVKIVAHVTDNSDIKDDEIQFTLQYNDSIIIDGSMKLQDNFLTYEFSNSKNDLGMFSYTITAEDNSGKKETFDGTFLYNNDVLTITSSRFEDIRSGDTLVIDADEDLFSKNFRVYYTIDNGSEINVNRDEKDNKERYETSAEYEGWKQNKNQTIRVFAEVMYYFKNMPQKFNNTVTDTTVYSFSTGQDANIGTKQPLLVYNCSRSGKQKDNMINYSIPCPSSITVPGFEVLLVTISLLVVILLFKYKKKHQHR